MKFVLGVLLLGITVVVANAAAPASDKASNTPYEPGNTWVNSQNGGTGFGAWVLTSGTNSGFFMDTSSNNGAMPPSGNIDTAGKSWGMFANSGDTASAVRPFTGPSNGRQLAVGQSISLAMDNGNIQTGGMVGFALNDGLGAARFEFYYLGGDSVDSYKININGVQFNLNPVIPFTANGFSNITFTLGASNTWSLFITENGVAGTETYSSANFANLAASNIAQIRFFDVNAGSGTSNDAYFNSLSINAVPEPSTIWAMLAASCGSVLLVRRRRA
jgi:hypothetical protein